MTTKMSRRQFLYLTTLFAGATAMQACAPKTTTGTTTGTTAGKPKDGGTLTLVSNQGIPQLDPHVVTYANERNVYPGLYTGLTEYDQDMNVVPALAEKWDISADSKTYTWTLRKGVKFHNGREVEAEDIKWNYERCLDEKLGSQMRNNVQEVEKIEVVDKYTVKMYLKSPSVTLPMGAQELKIIAKECLDNINKAPVGTGPYMFSDFVPNETLTLKRFDGWFGGKPHLDKVVITAIKDNTAALNALKSGQADVIWQISPKDAVTLKDDAKIKMLTARANSSNYFWEPDTTSPPFDKKEVRQAFSYAIPRQEIVDVALFGYGKPSWTNNFVPEGHWAYNPNLIKYEYNLDKAKQMFAAAGIKEGTEFIWWGLAGILPEFQTFGELMAHSLAKIGLKLKIEQNEVGKWVEAFYPSGKKFPNYVVPNGDTAALDPAFPLKFFAQKRCECNYNDPKIDELLAKGKSSTDKEVRKSAYQEIQKIVNEVVPAWIPCSWTFVNGAQKFVEGVWIESGGQIHYQEAWLNK
jgi:peptide/nickel transport system substrate-binding protein